MKTSVKQLKEEVEDNLQYIEIIPGQNDILILAKRFLGTPVFRAIAEVTRKRRGRGDSEGKMLHYPPLYRATPSSSHSGVPYFTSREADNAAIAPSPTAVATCIPLPVQSPAAKTPSIFVLCSLSTRIHPR